MVHLGNITLAQLQAGRVLTRLSGAAQNVICCEIFRKNDIHFECLMLSCLSQGSQDSQSKGHTVIPNCFPVLLHNFFSPTAASHIQLHLLPTILSSPRHGGPQEVRVHRRCTQPGSPKAPPLQSPNFFRVGQTRPSLHLKPHPLDPPETWDTWDMRSCKVFHGFFQKFWRDSIQNNYIIYI